MLIECMDVCFGLSRKKSQGEGLSTPKHKDLLFGYQDDSDNFVDHYRETNVSENVTMSLLNILFNIILPRVLQPFCMYCNLLQWTIQPVSVALSDYIKCTF